MNMATTRKKASNPKGKYMWLRTQIGSMLKNQVYLGHVVNGKKEQISPKIKKGKLKDKKEYIIVENMHEPIISQEVWDKVQERLAFFKTDNKKKYEHLLKDIVFCADCGAKTSLRHHKSKTKKGVVCWEGNWIVCTRRNSHKNLCDNKPIGEHIIMRVLKDVVREEIGKINYSKTELKNIYNKSNIKKCAKEDTDVLDLKKKELKKIEKKFELLYNKKLEKLIDKEEFKKEYSLISAERDKINMEMQKLEREKIDQKENIEVRKADIEYLKIAETFLKMDNIDIEIIKKLVKRIEFDKEKNITVTLMFSNMSDEDTKEYIVSGEKYLKK